MFNILKHRAITVFISAKYDVIVLYECLVFYLCPFDTIRTTSFFLSVSELFIQSPFTHKYMTKQRSNINVFYYQTYMCKKQTFIWFIWCHCFMYECLVFYLCLFDIIIIIICMLFLWLITPSPFTHNINLLPKYS